MSTAEDGPILSGKQVRKDGHIHTFTLSWDACCCNHVDGPSLGRPLGLRACWLEQLDDLLVALLLHELLVRRQNVRRLKLGEDARLRRDAQG